MNKIFPVPDDTIFDLGIDPEVFVKVGTKLLPAFEFLPAKERAEWTVLRECIPSITGLHYWDGFQAEFSLNKGIRCLQILTKSARHALQMIQQAAKKVHPKAELVLDNVVRVPQELLDTAIDPFVALGCMPSENAYGLHGIDVVNPRKLKYRMAGGHMHFARVGSYAVKDLDAVVGVWSVGAAEGIDNPIRRKYYGLAGEYRLPKHGLEYRVLSNFYYGHPALFNVTWDIARKAIQGCSLVVEKAWIADEREVIRVINENDVSGARKILKANKNLLLYWLTYMGYSSRAAFKAYAVGMQGAETVFKEDWNINIRDIATNWHLDEQTIWSGQLGNGTPRESEFTGLCR